MVQTLIAYAVTTILFFGLDFAWLSLSMNPVYKRHLGGLLLDKPKLPIAAIFYLVYVVGILAFALLPAQESGNWLRALWGGALLGLVAYGTYDMTNWSTVSGWSPFVSLVDMAWGTILTGGSATGAYFILRLIQS